MDQKFITVPFDLLKAKQISNGELEGNIVTRDGRNARIICWDYRNTESIVALVSDEKDVETVAIYFGNGAYYTSQYSGADLFLQLPEYLTFKDGDVLYARTGKFWYIFIYKYKNEDKTWFYAAIDEKNALYIEDNRISSNEEILELRLATDSEKQQLIGSLQVSTNPRAIDCLKKLGVEIKPKCNFTAGQPVKGMKQHMTAKVKSAKEYTAVIVEKAEERHKDDIDAVMKIFREGYVSLAFEAGWDAAVNYLVKLPFDKMFEYFNEVVKDVTMEDVIEENKDVLKRLKEK